jgi:short-subunit dehydrogenase
MAKFRDYRDKVALVTGASSGIGAELARQLADRGMVVALVARRQERLEKLASEIGGRAGLASAHACDVSDREAVERTAREVLAANGRVDLLANCAGYARHILFKDHAVEDVEAMMQTNYLGVVYWIKALLPHMRTRGSGWILNFSSFAGKIGQADEAAYSATKFAITGLSEAIAGEFEPLGIGVTCVHPVLVRTEMFTDQVIDRMPRNALKRFIGAPEFVAQVLRALERGDRQVVLPRSMGWVPILRDLFPGPMGRIIARVKLKDLPDVTS